MNAIISTSRHDDGMFAVRLHPAPSFPDDQPTKPIDVQPFVLIAANDDGGAWGWVNLNQEEKELIGQQLLDDHRPGHWYWCKLNA